MQFDAKLKKELREKLEAFYEQILPKENFIDPQLYKLIVEVTHKTGFEVAVLINRRGRVVDIFVGNKTSVSIPVSQNEYKGFNGIRVIHTHPNGNSTLSELDKSFLFNNMFDCVCAIGVKNGQAIDANVGVLEFFDDELKITNTFVHNADYINKFGLLEKIEQNEKEYIKLKTNLHTNSNSVNRAVIVVVEIEKTDELQRDLKELSALCETAGIEVVDAITQKRHKPDGKYYVGEGKLQELKSAVQNTNANIVVFDSELSGSKQKNLYNVLGVDVIDRSMLILDIFAKRARTSEGKLQVELAQLKYLLPRVGSIIRGHDGGSGIGLKGPGESKIDLNKRIIENNILKKERELEQVRKNRDVTRTSRMKSSKPIISIVGYTNSGKSTLMNTLANANVYEKDELFATLDTTTRNVWLETGKEFLLIDTVGFINKLPHEFIKAFSSTLEESVFADLLLHVVDASDKNYENHIKIVKQLLNKIGAKSEIITVYNKIDKVKDLQSVKNTAEPNSVFISAKKQTNINDLKLLVASKLDFNI